MKKECAERRAPIQDLLTATKAVGNDLDRALKQFSAADAPGKGKPSKTASKNKEMERPVCGHSCPSCPSSDLSQRVALNSVQVMSAC